MIRLLAVLFSISSVISQDTPRGCVKEEFSCSDGTCIPDQLLCNGVNDCNNGLDEFVCIIRGGLTCPPDRIQCGGDDIHECVRLGEWCDGVRNCANGEDESDCSQRSNSSCLISEFECPFLGGILSNASVTECIPRAYQCDNNHDCANGGDEATCSPPVITVPPAPVVSAFHGSTPSFVCVAEGSPTPTVTWLRNLRPLTADPRYRMVSEGGRGVLLIANATVFDQGEYSCVATNPFEAVTAKSPAELKVINSDPFTCSDVDANQYNESSRFYDIQTQTFGDAATAAADVIFVVDESGSMQNSHEWIRMVVPLLDESFKDRGLGIGLRDNLFALVGFGQNMIPEREGVVLTGLTSVEGFLNASHGLSEDGLFEDGYSAIEVALDQIALRDDSHRLMIFISNEPRVTLIGKEDLTRATIEQRLRENNFILNSIVAQGILSDAMDSESFAFALDANGTAYSFASLTEFAKTPNGLVHPDDSFTVGSTFEDYTQLALNLNGAVFDVRQIETGGSILDPFTEAFVDVKVSEVTGVLKRCLNCLCIQPDVLCRVEVGVQLNNCTGVAPPDSALTVRIFPIEPQVVEGSTLNLTCEVNVSPPGDPVQISWRSIGSMDICSSRAECVGNTAVIRDFRQEDGGVYICEATSSSQIVSDLTTVMFKSPPMVTITDSPVDGEVTTGKPIMLTCTATGVSLPSIIWRKGNGDTLNDPNRVFINTFQQGEILVSELVIDPAVIGDADTYECVATNNVGSDSDSTTVDVLLIECRLMDGSVLDTGDSRVLFFIDEASRSADIVLVVDESGSMETEHRWIVNMTRRLDEALRELEIGKNMSNQFGIVGFGSFDETSNNGRIVRYNGESFVEANDVEQLVQMLRTSGRNEDGYLALKFAFDNYVFRPNVAKQFILITDEERDILDNDLNKTVILDLLRGSQLGAVVSEAFESSTGNPAIGIDSLGNAYIYDPLSSVFFRNLEGGRPIKDSGYGSINIDYTDLALLSEGSAWNLLLLRQGGQVAEAFTEAFVRATIEEIYSRISRCLNCTCHAATGLACQPIINRNIVPECNLTQILSSILPSVSQPPSTLGVNVLPSLQRHLSGLGDAELTCTIDRADGVFLWTFNGGQLPTGVMISNMPTESVLRIEPVTKEHNGIYTCLVRRSDEIGSDTAFIEISELHSPLGVEVTASELTVPEGQNVSFLCTSNGPVTYQWNFNQGQPLPDNVQIEILPQSSVLTITNTMLSNQGRYFCVAQGNSPLVTDEDFGKLYVYTPILMIALEPSTSIVTDVGSNVTLICRLDCLCPGASIIWRRGFNGTLPDSALVKFNSDQTEVVLTFNNVGLNDCDLYTCIGEFGSQRETIGTHIILRESDEFEVVLNANSSLLVEAGSNQSLTCSSTSEVTEWRWLFNNNSNLPSSVEVFDLPGTNRTSLFICDVQAIHVGSYECEGINSNGDIARDISLLQIVKENGFSSSMAHASTSIEETFTTNVQSSSISETNGLTTSFSNEASESISRSAIISMSQSQIMTSSSNPESMPSTIVSTYSQSISESKMIITESPIETSSIQSSNTESQTVDSSLDEFDVLTSSFDFDEFSSLPISDMLFSSTLFERSTTFSEMFRASSVSETRSSIPIQSTTPSSFSETKSIVPTSASTSVSTSTTVSTTTSSSSVPMMLLTPVVSDSELNLFPGTPANITCTSNVPAMLTWTFTASSFPDNVWFKQVDETTAILFINNFDGGRNEGSYQCLARAGGIERGVRISITAREMLMISVSNRNFVSAPMDPPSNSEDVLTVICKLSCSCGGAKVEWITSDGRPFPSSVAIDTGFSMRESKLMFKSISFDVAGDYLCIASFRSNSESIIVQETFTMDVLETPLLMVTPGEITVPAGGDVTFTCEANRNVSVFTWTHTTAINMMPLPTSVSFTTISGTRSELTVRNVQRNINNGQYFCQAIFDRTLEQRSTAGNIVIMSDLALRIDKPEPENGVVMFNRGDTINLECRVDCPCGGTQAEWSEPSDLPQGLTKDQSFSKRVGFLESSSAQPNHSGFYTCRVFNSISQDSITEQIEIIIN